MKVLIMMVLNSKEKTYHPIVYFEHNNDGNGVYDFKSQGHRTVGFKEREDAIQSIEKELIPFYKGNNQIHKDLNEDLLWNGQNSPIGRQLRNSKDLERFLITS